MIGESILGTGAQMLHRIREACKRIEGFVNQPQLRGKLRHTFQWKYSSVAIPALWPLGMAIVALATVDFVPDKFFLLSKVIFLLALIWSLGSWINSQALAKINPRSWSRAKRRSQDAATGKKRYLAVKWGVSGLLVLFFALCFGSADTIQLNKSLASYEGYLYPGNQPAPLKCDLGKDDLAIYLGDDYGFTASRLPLTVFRGGAHLRPVIKIDRRNDGSISIDADIKSDDQRLIVSIVNNFYTINHNNILKMSRKNDAHDQSSLSVTDQYGNEVLFIHYLNSHAFQVKARLSIDGHVLDTSKLPLSGGCINVLKGPEGAVAVSF
jgi:hypothetical protein